MFDFLKKLFGKKDEPKTELYSTQPSLYYFGHNLNNEHSIVCNAVKNARLQISAKGISNDVGYVEAKHGDRTFRFELVMPKHEGDFPVLVCKYIVGGVNYSAPSNEQFVKNFNKVDTFVSVSIDAPNTHTIVFAHYEMDYSSDTLKNVVDKFVYHVRGVTFSDRVRPLLRQFS